VKFAGNESIGGYDARRYDFDLTVEADIKKAMVLGNAFGSARKTKDYNVKGSAWIARNDGRLVKFSFENIYTFSDGNVQSTHFPLIDQLRCDFALAPDFAQYRRLTKHAKCFGQEPPVPRMQRTSGMIFGQK
jgi:hypothetical protein